MNFFWPMNQKSEPTALNRFGRVLHWSAILIAASITLIGLFATITDGAAVIFIALLFAVPIYLAGRAARYVLGGE